MKNNLTHTWLLLLACTLAAFYTSETTTGRSLAAGIMGFGLIKFLLVGWQYIGLKDAHPLWRWYLAGFIIIFSGLIILLM